MTTDVDPVPSAPFDGPRDDDGDLRGDQHWASIPALCRSAAERFHAAEALVDGDERLSWNDLAERVDRAARAFVGAGVQPGDRVAIWAPNCWEWVVAMVGIQAAGGVLVPLNTRFKGGEAAWILRRSRARVLVTVDGFLGNGYVAMLEGEELPDVELTVVIRDTPPAGTEGWGEFLKRGDGVDDEEVDRRRDALGGDTVSDITFTSGTTGHPKGVEITHGQGLRAFTTWADVVGLRSGDRYLIVNPFFHSFGNRAGIVASMISGATMIPLAVFDVPEVLRLVDDEQVSMLPGPPSLYQAILNHPDRGDLSGSALRLAVTGAAAVPVSLVAAMRDELGFQTVLTAYGLSEASGVVTMCRHDDDPETISTTSGRAIPGVEVRIVDGEGSARPAGEAGEIVVRGYNVMRGYLDDPDQTAEVMDAEGWLHTGDVGVMDDRGYVAITDRTKDMFIVGGFNTYPAEVEAILSRHPAVALAAVVGVPDERQGEVGFAFVVGAIGVAQPSEDDLVAWSREAMANYKVPRSFRFVDALPLNASGKVQKFALRARAREETGSAPSEER